MKKLIVSLLALALALTACQPSATYIEQEQQSGAQVALIQNQPAPDLGGRSFEREIVRQTIAARNQTIATYAYSITMTGEIIEICASIGYPIPYSTQLTNPEKVEFYNGAPYTLPNPEPNGLYPPGDAAATLIQCVNPDGTVSPVYWEWYVMAFPYQIKSDRQIERIGEPSFSVETGQK